MNTQILEPDLNNKKIVLEWVNLSARERDVNDDVCSELETKGISVLGGYGISKEFTLRSVCKMH